MLGHRGLRVDMARLKPTVVWPVYHGTRGTDVAGGVFM